MAVSILVCFIVQCSNNEDLSYHNADRSAIAARNDIISKLRIVFVISLITLCIAIVVIPSKDSAISAGIVENAKNTGMSITEVKAEIQESLNL